MGIETIVGPEKRTSHGKLRGQHFTEFSLFQAIRDGENLLAQTDQRGWAMRRLKGIASDLWHDLGAFKLSTQQMILLRRAAMLTLQIELFEQQWARKNGKKKEVKPMHSYELSKYVVWVNSLARILSLLGLDADEQVQPFTNSMSAEQCKDYLESRGIRFDRLYDDPEPPKLLTLQRTTP